MSKRNKTKLYVSKKQILDIKEFMDLYVGKEYTWSEQLTHNKMTEFLNIKKFMHQIEYVLIIWKKKIYLMVTI